MPQKNNESSDFQEKTERMQRVLAKLQEVYPNAQTELLYQNPYQLLVAVVLSAQCTDVRINKTTPALFEAFPNPESLAAASPEIIFPYVRSVSYPNSKAKNLVAMARQLVENHNGIIPNQVEALIKLPGVGRKTAHVVCSVLYGMPTLAVDTHVFRVSRRLGFAAGKTPQSVEKELTKIIPPEQIHTAHHLLILHGRRVCAARKPNCNECLLSADCPKNF